MESDDWGSIRMPSTEVYNNLLKKGINFNADEGFRYNKYDSLATSEDLSALFEVLSSVKDSTGRSAVITPYAVVANPDFEKILHSDFNEYHYIPINETMKEYRGCENSFKLWKEGLQNRLFMPQFHGREHLNVKVWMRALKSGHRNTRLAFENRMWGISTAEDPEIRIELQAAFDFIDPTDLVYHKDIIISGLTLFNELFGYRPTCFVPSNGLLSSKLEPICSNEGIRYLSTSKIQMEPVGNNRTVKRIHWLGRQNKTGLTYVTRNCFFEPSHEGHDWINSCLNDISNAFRWNKPVIINSHRVNYIGALHPSNRENGLKQLKTLLKEITKHWKDVEFLDSSELGDIFKY